MHIDYIARKVTLTDQVRQFTEKKVAKVEKYFQDILDIRVEIDQERHRYVADIFIKGKDFDIKSTTQHKELNAAIQELQKLGYDLPDYPEEPKDDAEQAIKARYAKAPNLNDVFSLIDGMPMRRSEMRERGLKCDTN